MPQRREGSSINHKRLFRLYREEHLKVRRRGGRKRAIGTRAPMMIPMRPNERWSLDFVSDQFTCGVSVVLPPPFAGEAEGAMFRAWRAWTYDDFRAYA